MTRKWIRPGFRIPLYATMGLLLFLGTLVPVHAAPVTMSPHRIILNAELKGALQDVQAVIGMSMPSGYRLADFEVLLLLDDVFVAEAFAFRYCDIDDNFLASFDREVIQNDPFVVENAGNVLTATVDGWYEAVNADGDTIKVEFSGQDSVEIIKPGNKK